MSLQAQVRFLLFPSGKEFTKLFPVETTFLKVKNSIFTEWPANFPPLSSLDELRLIHSGRIIEEKQTVQEVFKITENDVSVTVHITIKRRSPSLPKAAPVEEEETIHYHFCGIDEEEVSMINAIFEKKKGQDDKIAFAEVEKFLKAYWTWMKRNNFKDSACPFPAETLLALKTKIIGPEDRNTRDQFRQVFYLFDNVSSEHKCPHGEKPRVQFSTQQLHHSIQPDSEFCLEIFDIVFKDVDKDGDGVLSCKELELLYYLYSTRIMECK